MQSSAMHPQLVETANTIECPKQLTQSSAMHPQLLETTTTLFDVDLEAHEVDVGLVGGCCNMRWSW